MLFLTCRDPAISLSDKGAASPRRRQQGTENSSHLKKNTGGRNQSLRVAKRDPRGSRTHLFSAPPEKKGIRQKTTTTQNKQKQQKTGPKIVGLLARPCQVVAPMALLPRRGFQRSPLVYSSTHRSSGSDGFGNQLKSAPKKVDHLPSGPSWNPLRGPL